MIQICLLQPLAEPAQWCPNQEHLKWPNLVFVPMQQLGLKRKHQVDGNRNENRARNTIALEILQGDMVRRTNVNGLIFSCLVAIITPVWFCRVDDCPSHIVVNTICYNQLLQCFDKYVLDGPHIAVRPIKVNKNAGILCRGDPYWILCFGVTLGRGSRESSTAPTST